MNRSDRMLAIVLELQSKGTLRAEDLAETFEVSKRSVYRDIDALCRAGVPVVAVPGRGYSLMHGYFLPPLSFTVDEATMLLVGGDVAAQNFDDEYRAAARSAMEKLAAVLPDRQRADVHDLRASIRFVRVESLHAAEELAKLRTIRQAIVARRTIHFTYNARGAGGHDAPRRSDRAADPYALSHIDGAWYLVAHCRLRNAVRNFRLSRMEDLKITADRFTRPADFKPTTGLDEGNHVTALVLFEHDVAQWVRESGYYFKVREEDRDDGLLVTLQARNEADMLPWLLSWGSRARVLAPDSLATLLREEAKKMFDRHTTP